MNLESLEPVSSGSPYRVTEVDGRAAAVIGDFVGPHSFGIHQREQHAAVTGIGALDPDGAGVRFYQKDVAHEGRDVRIWHIAAVAGDFVAQHQAAI